MLCRSVAGTVGCFSSVAFCRLLWVVCCGPLAVFVAGSVTLCRLLWLVAVVGCCLALWVGDCGSVAAAVVTFVESVVGRPLSELVVVDWSFCFGRSL